MLRAYVALNVRRETVVALRAVEHSPKVVAPAFRRCNPRPVRPGRLMADVLMVSALELGHPVLLFILVIADDAFLHTRLSACLTRSVNEVSVPCAAARRQSTNSKDSTRRR